MTEGELTLHEVAAELGVHYMTAYRYVRLGTLPAHRQGGGWRVLRRDLEEFRAQVAADGRPGAGARSGAGGRSGPGATSESGSRPPARRRAPWAERLEARLVAGDARGAWGVVEGALAAGADLEEVYLGVISPALRSIGVRWAGGELDIGVEHRASGITLRMMGRLGPRFARRGRSRGTVVLGAPAGEQHSLPVALVADLARGAGFDVSDLGADVPTTSFVVAAQEAPRLVAVGVGVTSPGQDEVVAETVAALRGALDGVVVLVGGGAIVDADHARSLGASAWASDGRGVVTVLDRAVRGDPLA